MVIVGGGYIAAELAHLFSSLGVSIHLINQAGSLLETFDPEVSGRFTELARKCWGRPAKAASTASSSAEHLVKQSSRSVEGQSGSRAAGQGYGYPVLAWLRSGRRD
jgi:pyruvate/2-oxoglutarate dehydrogenase complex dihydrolipoamide dehydrogenase (E3) component